MKEGKKSRPMSLGVDPLPQFNCIAALAIDDISRQGLILGFLIHDVSRMRRSAYDNLMRPLGITRARWWVLAHLTRCDGMMQGHLASILDIGRASLGGLIEGLEREGLITRTSDPVDKRIKRIFLARAAHQIVRRMYEKEKLFNNQILGGLSSADRDELIRLLLIVKKSLSQADNSA